nr:hypothetical protein [uncultured Treponema sp.]
MNVNFGGYGGYSKDDEDAPTSAKCTAVFDTLAALLINKIQLVFCFEYDYDGGCFITLLI